MSKELVNIEMPDGTIIEGVPDGTTQDEVMRRYKLMSSPSPDFARPTNQPQIAAPTGPTRQRFENKVGDDILAGIGSGVFNTGLGVSKILGAVPPETTLEDIGMQPTNDVQKVGMAAEQIGEFFIPGAAARRIPKVAALTNRALGRAAVEATGAGIVTAAQTGGDEDASLKASLIAGTIPIAAPIVGKGLKKVGAKIQESVLRSTDADRRAGYSLTNVLKHNVGGSPQDVANKSAAKIQTLADELKAELAKTPNADIDLFDALAKAQADLGKAPATTFGRNAPTEQAFNKLLEEIIRVNPTGKVNLADAQSVKRSLGLLGSWISGARDPESKGMELAANAMYTKVRQAIEGAAVNGAKVKALNKELGELIPIEHVAVKRIPVAERQNLVSLTDIITLANVPHSPANFWLFMANKASKSGKVGNVMTRTGQGVTGQVAAPAAAAGFVRATRD